MKNNKFNKKMLIIITSLLFSFSLFGGQKDVIMVLDTSLSMVGQGRSGKNIMAAVKSEIKKFIYEDIKDGDRLTFMTFDSKVVEYATIKIDDENDRNIASKFLLRVEPKGLWTHTQLMVDKVIEKSKELEKTADGRKLFVIILTDNLDDPPPGKKGKRLSIKELLKGLVKNPKAYVYYVNFGAFKAAVDKKAGSSKGNLKIVNAGSDTKNALKDVKKGIKDDESNSTQTTLVIIFIIFAAVLIGLAIGAFLKRRSSHEVSGSLEYWSNDVLSPLVETIDFTSLVRKEITIGNNIQNVVAIRDLVASSNLVFTSETVDGVLKTKLQTGDGEAISFKNRGEGNYLENGDIFLYGNYSFKYISL